MTEPRPSGDQVDDEVANTSAKSAEDRKAASALASLDAPADDASAAKNVDQDAVNKAMKNLGEAKAPAPTPAATTKAVKVDQADVALLVDELELTKVKATELLKANEGDAVKAMRAFIHV